MFNLFFTPQTRWNHENEISTSAGDKIRQGGSVGLIKKSILCRIIIRHSFCCNNIRPLKLNAAKIRAQNFMLVNRDTQSILNFFVSWKEQQIVNQSTHSYIAFCPRNLVRLILLHKSGLKIVDTFRTVWQKKKIG